MRILVVNNNFTDRKHAARMLESTLPNYLIEKVGSLNAAKNRLVKHHYDAVFLQNNQSDNQHEQEIRTLQAIPDAKHTAIIIIADHITDSLNDPIFPTRKPALISKQELGKSSIKQTIIKAKNELKVSDNESRRIQDVYENDPLTGLFNRHHFIDNIDNYGQEISQTNEKSALVLININKFRFINDDFGHAVGDRLITLLVRRLQGILDGAYKFCRLHGDCFGIFFCDYKSQNEIELFTSRLLSSIEQPYILNNKRLTLTLSVGVSSSQNSDIDASRLIQQAEIAMYRAKNLGPNRVCYFVTSMKKEFIHSYKLESDMNDLVRENKFEVHYQPILCANNKTVKGYEALLRWPRSHGHCHCEPDEFIPIAEQSSLIIQLGEWVAKQAIKDMKEFQIDNAQALTMSINVSPLQLITPSFTEMLLETLDEYNVSPKDLIVEITETALMYSTDIIKSSLQTLSDAGIQIALDDFGTGYSSISHLMNFPVNIVKVDKTLFELEGKQLKHIALLKGLVSMLQGLELVVVAEGIEHPMQHELCNKLKVDNLQGYLFGKPCPKNPQLDAIA